MLKLGLSLNGTGKKAFHRENLLTMKKAGIDAIEVSAGRDLSLALDYKKLANRYLK